jgi:magnesium chelatase family protein
MWKSGALAADELVERAARRGHGQTSGFASSRRVTAPSPGRAAANQALEGRAIDAQCQLDDAAAKFLNTAAARLGWSGRSIHRCLKVARTIADLAGAQAVQTVHVAEAVQYRRALARGPN